MQVKIYDNGKGMAIKFVDYSQRMTRIVQQVPMDSRIYFPTAKTWVVEYEHFPYVEQALSDAGAEFKILSLF